MSIQVSCPNGHQLRVKDSYAGKSGCCPHCRAKVHVPVQAGFSEDDVMGILGPAPPMPGEAVESAAETNQYVHQEPRHVQPAEESGIGLAGSSILRHAKVCPSCKASASFSFSICPRCGTPLPEVDAVRPR